MIVSGIVKTKNGSRHRRNFTLDSGGAWPVASPGFGVRGQDDRRAKGAEWGRVWGGVSLPQPTRGSGWASWAPPAGSGDAIAFSACLGQRTVEKLLIPLWKSGGHHHFQKWWWQVTYKVAPLVHGMTEIMNEIRSVNFAYWAWCEEIFPNSCSQLSSYKSSERWSLASAQTFISLTSFRDSRVL